MGKKDIFQTLLKKYIEGKCNSEEIDILFSYFQDGECDSIYKDAIASELENPHSIPQLYRESIIRITHNVELNLEQAIPNQNIPSKSIKIKSLWISLAASVLLIFSFSIYHLFFANHVVEGEAAIEFASDIFHTEESPVLTFGNGHRVVLSDIDELSLNDSSSLQIISNGEFLKDSDPSLLTLNKLYVPKGRQLKVNFPDGSSIWLNANTTLIYPSEFISERKIILSGKGYFEVAKDDKKPFIIESGNQRLTVKGTIFNLTAYPDEESIKTELVSGSVEVKTLDNKSTKILKPGHQSILRNEVFEVGKIDVEKISLWKQGYFDFEDYDLLSITKELQRWYDVEIVFEGQIPKKEFFGKIRRDSSLGEVLSIFKAAGINFKIIENKKIVIIKNE